MLCHYSSCNGITFDFEAFRANPSANDTSPASLRSSRVEIAAALMKPSHAYYKTDIRSGLLLGTIFPLWLSKILALANDSPRTKWAFGICEFGGAPLRWLTGNTHHGSLGVS